MNQSSRSIRAQLAFGPVAVLTLAMSACVSGTPYQRAQDLQSAQASADEVTRSLTDPNWKLRCLASRACGSRPEVPCLSKLRDLAIHDPSVEVRACALEGLAALCDHGGRSELAAIAKGGAVLSHDPADQSEKKALPAASQTPPTVTPLEEALAKCRSADAVFALAHAGTGGTLLDEVAGSEQVPSDAGRRRDWLQSLSQLPDPRHDVLQELQATEATVRADEASAKVASEAEARAEAEQIKQAKALLEKAERQIEEKDFAGASSSIDSASGLGADTSGIKGSLEKAHEAAAGQSITRAWRLAKLKKFAEAFGEYQDAVKLGRTDLALEQLISSSAWGKRRSLEEADSRLGDYLHKFPEAPTDCEESWLTQEYPRFARFKQIECSVEPHSLLFRFDAAGRVNSVLAYVSRKSEKECLAFFRSISPSGVRSAGKRIDPSRRVYVVDYYFTGIPEDYVVAWSHVSGEDTCTVTICNPAAGPMAGTDVSNQCRPR